MAIFTRKQSREVAREIHKQIKKGNYDYELMIVADDISRKSKYKLFPREGIIIERPEWENKILLFMKHRDIEHFSKGNLKTIQGIEDAVYESVNINLWSITRGGK